MKLADIVNQVRRRANEVITIARYPVQMGAQAAYRRFSDWYANAEIGGSKANNQRASQGQNQSSSASGTPHQQNSHNGAANGYANGHSPASASLDDISNSEGQNPNQADFHLPSGEILKSRWNSYTIGDREKVNSFVQVYQARSRNDDQVLIQEYRFDKDRLNSQEIEERLKAFERLIELNLGLGNGPDFRIVKLIDAISLPKERCCYLITRPIRPSTSLDDYLDQHPNLPPHQVREVLRQVLESLQFLHEGYRVYYPSGEAERGLPHGNINLHSLLIRHIDFNTRLGDQQFFIYLTHLELWEHLFYPPGSPHFYEQVAKSSQNLGSIKQDLEDLGKVGVYLLLGKSETLSNSLSNLPNLPAWQQISDRPLKAFIERLLGLETPFTSAEEARQSLLALPESNPAKSAQITGAENQLIPENHQLFPRSRPIFLGGIAVLSLGALGMISWVAWRQVSTPNSPSPIPWTPKAEITTFDSVKTIPTTPITYGVERGAWDFALSQTFFAPDSSQGKNVRQNLISALHCFYDNLKLEDIAARKPTSNSNSQFITSDSNSEIEEKSEQEENRCQANQPDKPHQKHSSTRFTRDQLLAQIESGKVQVGLMQLTGEIPATLQKKPIANDALVVIVPFRDPYIARKTVVDLQGRITVEELREIFTGKEDVTQLREQTVKLFFPEDSEQATINLFHQLVLNNDSNLIKKFETLRKKAKIRDAQSAAKQRQTKDIYNRMWVDFNNQTGEKVISIGFDRLGRMFNQCSVYPLAVSQGSASPVQVLVKSDGTPIDNNFDLCAFKNGYFPRLEDYPLSYELGIVSRQNSPAGNAIAQILTTTEGQYLLSNVGLIPQEPMPTLIYHVWGKK